MHTVTSGSHPHLVILTYTANLESEELLIDDELHLNEGHPIYLLVDVSEMNTGLPDHFLETVQRSFVIHPNIGHIAVCITSGILRVAAAMVIKVTRRQGKIRLYASYEAAYQELVRVMLSQKGEIRIEPAHPEI